jgi:hypothetical protein
MPPPRFQTFGVSVAPGIEAVVRHALEKDVGARIASVDDFSSDLRSAIDAAEATARSRNAPTIVDLNKSDLGTMPLIETQPPGMGGSTQAPIPVDTQFSTSEPSISDVSVLRATSRRFRQFQMRGSPNRVQCQEHRLSIQR